MRITPDGEPTGDATRVALLRPWLQNRAGEEPEQPPGTAARAAAWVWPAAADRGRATAGGRAGGACCRVRVYRGLARGAAGRPRVQRRAGWGGADGADRRDGAGKPGSRQVG